MTEAGWTSNQDAAETYADRAAIEAVRHVLGAHKLTCDEHEHLQQDFKDVALEAYQQGRVASCEWTYDDIDDYYETACKNAYCLADGTLKDNDHKYCPYCGGLIQLAQQA